MQLVELQTNIKKLKSAGLHIVAISYDSPKALAKFADKRKITYTLLSDPKSKVIAAFGVLNEKARGFTKGIPHPGTFIIGQNGAVEATLFYEGYRKRHNASDLIDAVRKK